MRHPPYHLRPNKAADRFMLVEVLRRLSARRDLSQYTYYGLGGPFLEDFRLMRDFFPETRLVSIERDDHTRKRQRFHLPAKGIRLRKGSVWGFINRGFEGGRREVFWLDCVGLCFRRFEEFMTVLSKVGDDSVVKVTVPAKPRVPHAAWKDSAIEEEFLQDFRMQYAQVTPNDLSLDLFREAPFARLLQDMFQIAAGKAVPAVTGRAFQIVCSTRYSDGTPMFTLTGIVCSISDVDEFVELYRGWPLANLDWADPTHIDIPDLSVKERLHLERYLPCQTDEIDALAKALGYRIEDSWEMTRAKLEQYSQFHRYTPYFGKILV